jgi:DNA-binding NtrC family response regulator
LRAVRESRFREDLYYRLCGDVIQTPSLRAQLDESPGDLEHLVLSVTERVIGERDKAITSDVTHWIAENMPRDYPWPGNVRELEQCVRNILIRGKYHWMVYPVPPNPEGDTDADSTDEFEVSKPDLVQKFCRVVFEKTGSHLSKEDLEGYYFRAVYKETGTYRAAARHLRVDERTVKKHVLGSEDGKTLSSHRTHPKPR